jgi:hypothetical protein
LNPADTGSGEATGGRRAAKAIAGEKHIEWRRISGRRQGEAAGACSHHVPAAAMQEAGEKTSRAVGFATEIA